MRPPSHFEEEIITGINVTPLVDISLVLLIIFMVTSYVIAQPSMKVSLPKATNTEATSAETFGLTLTKNHTLFLNDKTISEAALTALLAKRVQKDPDLQVVLSADREVAHGEVIQLLDLVRGTGVAKIAFSVDAK
jgi:biopolymer transport protein ExbD